MRELTCAEITEDALIERYVAGQLSDDDVEALESHYLTCARCYDELRFAVAIRETLPDVAAIDTRRLRILEGGITEAGDVAKTGEAPARGKRREAPTGTRLGRRLKAGAVAAMAAAAVLAGLMFLRPNQQTEGQAPIHRDATPGSEPNVAPQAPIGPVATAREFRWSPLASADLYRVTLFDDGGSVIWQTETPETRAALPEEPRLEPGESYLWEVAARVGWNRWVRSELTRFEISEP